MQEIYFHEHACKHILVEIHSNLSIEASGAMMKGKCLPPCIKTVHSLVIWTGFYSASMLVWQKMLFSVSDLVGVNTD